VGSIAAGIPGQSGGTVLLGREGPHHLARGVLARRLGEHNTVNVIDPGATETPVTATPVTVSSRRVR